MNLQDYAQSVTHRSMPVEGVEAGSLVVIVEIITTVISLLSKFPCIPKESTATDKRTFVEDHPRLCVVQTAQEIRKQARGEGGKVAVGKSRELATTIVNDFLSSSDDELKTMGLNI